MARKGKKESGATADPAASARFRKRVAIAALLVMTLAAAVAGYRAAWRYVRTELVFQSNPPTVVLKNRPVWMSDFLAEQIAIVARPLGTHSALDHQALVDSFNLLKSDLRISPWIKQIRQVRLMYGHKPGDTLLLDCQYRAPVAMVRWGEYFWLVDEQAVQLPGPFTAAQLPRVMLGQNGLMNIRLIEGVKNAPPGAGRRWSGEDVLAGLDMVKLLYLKPYAEEIMSVDVSNFAGRKSERDSHLVLKTKYTSPPSEIRWGRALRDADAFIEVSSERKLDALENVWRQYHRVDANQPWIDIRYDKITHPLPALEQDAPRGRAASSGTHHTAREARADGH